MNLPVDAVALDITQASGRAGPAEDEAFLRSQLITYIGNKRALLPFAGRVRENGCYLINLPDLSGVAQRHLIRHTIQR